MASVSPFLKTLHFRKPSFVEEVQFGFIKSELGKTAIWAEQEFRKYQHGRLVHIFQPGKMDVNLSIELCLVVRPAYFTLHTTPQTSD
jgi:hypothetical protein